MLISVHVYKSTENESVMDSFINPLDPVAETAPAQTCLLADSHFQALKIPLL